MTLVESDELTCDDFAFFEIFRVIIIGTYLIRAENLVFVIYFIFRRFCGLLRKQL